MLKSTRSTALAIASTAVHSFASRYADWLQLYRPTELLPLFHTIQHYIQGDTWQHLEPCDVLLVRHDGDCGYTYQGKAYAPLLDSIGDLCVEQGLRVRSVATPYAKLVGAHAHNSPVSYNRSEFITAHVSRVVRLIKGRALGIDWAEARSANLWCRILEHSKPKCVLGIHPDVGLCRAGKRMGTPVYDLQHGLIVNGAVWYDEKHQVDATPGDLPDGLLCWDESSASFVSKWALKKAIDVRVVGNPWFSRFLFQRPGDLLVQERVPANRIFKNERPTILVSLQWGLGRLFYRNSDFNGVLIAALEKTILETAGQYNWLLRLHPVQLRGNENISARRYLQHTFGHLDSVEWSACTELPLPLLLQQVDAHLTDSSSVVVEAAWMGIRSALLNPNLRFGGSRENTYSVERNLGMAEVLPQDAEVIKQWIVDTLAKGRADCTLGSPQALRVFVEEIARKTRVEDARKGAR